MNSRMERREQEKQSLPPFITNAWTYVRESPYRTQLIGGGIIALVMLFSGGLSYDGRVTLLAFLIATLLWSTTSLPAAYVALGSVLFIILLRAGSEELLFDALSSSVIWLMIGAFIVGGALAQSGLADRLTAGIARRAKTVSSLFWLTGGVVQLLAFFIPSTSGRAAVLYPFYETISDRIGRPAVTKALSMYIPVMVLVTTISTVIGASSHFIALELLSTYDRSISFVMWLVWGVPFSVLAGIGTTWLLKRQLLTKEEWREDVAFEHDKRTPLPLSRNEKMTLWTLGGMMLFWVTEPIHGIHMAFTTMVGAFILLAPRVGVLTFGAGMKAVSWKLIVFVGAAMALGTAMVESGVAEWIVDGLFSVTGWLPLQVEWLAITFIALIALTSHLYMTSHTTRAIVLLPPIVYLGMAQGWDPVAVVFLATVGMNVCLTFPVSSKALLVYYKEDGSRFSMADLRKLSLNATVFHLVLMVLFALTWWKWTGLSL